MNGDTFLLFVRLGFSLAIVFGLMWVAARVVKGRTALPMRKRADHVEVLERKSLSRTSSIAVVRVGEQVLALGVSDQNVTVLSEVSLDPVEADAAAAAATGTGAPAGVRGLIGAAGGISVQSIDALPTPSRPLDSVHPGGDTATPSRSSGHGWLDTLRDKTVRHIPS